MIGDIKNATQTNPMPAERIDLFRQTIPSSVIAMVTGFSLFITLVVWKGKEEYLQTIYV